MEEGAAMTYPINRTPAHLRCPAGDCPSVHQREDGKLLIRGEFDRETGIDVAANEATVIIDPALLGDVVASLFAVNPTQHFKGHASDRDANAVRSPEDEKTLGQVAYEGFNLFKGNAICWPLANGHAITEMNAWEAAATAVRDKVMEWKTIETMQPGLKRALLYSAAWGQRPIQAAYVNGNGIMVIGGAFAFDVENPTHWMPLPSPPCVPDRRD